MTTRTLHEGDESTDSIRRESLLRPIKSYFPHTNLSIQMSRFFRDLQKVSSFLVEKT